ncbi:MFS transporter [Microlunatus soli]|uniref:Predicted arabinose efflux permease, MFS family n=1 Tax=Microlunatus soli TaxID=630515 RepID=A0A1H1MJC9_9ACTN|nr:MFS transporter [Microlunatus soli]SDR86485.1 Predicted arabinose efflux permease, MFS family [Microlunatus soli]
MPTESLTVRSPRDIIDYVNDHPTGTGRTRILALIALGGIFVDAYDFTSLGIGMGSLTKQWDLGAGQVGLLTSVMALGALVGALAGGPLVDRIGRYKMFVLDLILFVVAAVAAGLAPNYGFLVVCRFFLGVGVGIDMPASFSFIAEFTDRRRKGGYVNFWQAMWYVAVVGAAIIALPLLLLAGSENLWRWMVGLGAVPALIVLLLRLRFTEESPMWAAQNLGLQEAASILRSSYKINVVVAPDAAAERAPTESPLQRLRELFTPRFRIRTALASIISGTQAAQYFAVGFYIPTIAAVLFGDDLVATILATLVINTFGIIGGVLQSLVTARLGMRLLAGIGYTLIIICTLGLAIGSDSISVWISTGLVALFVFGQSFGPGPQGKTMAALSYPTRLRGTGTGWAESMSRVGSIIGFYVFPLLLASLGLAGTMGWLTVIPAVGLVAVLLIKWNPIGADVEDEPAVQQSERRS